MCRLLKQRKFVTKSKNKTFILYLSYNTYLYFKYIFASIETCMYLSLILKVV